MARLDIPRARLRVYYRAPSLRVALPLMEAKAFAHAATLVFDVAEAGRYHMEDSRGVRIADLHPSPEQPIAMALVGVAPFFLRTAAREAQISAEATAMVAGSGRARIEVGALEFAPVAEGSRGSVEVTFRKHLFELAFGRGFLRGLTAEHREADIVPLLEPPPPPPTADVGSSVSPLLGRRPTLRTWAWRTLTVAAAAGVAAGVTYWTASQAHDQYDRASTADEARNLRRSTEQRLLTSRILLGATGALATGAAALFVVDHLRGRNRPEVALLLVPDLTTVGIGVGGRF